MTQARHLAPEDITTHLDRWQQVMQAMDKQADALYALMGYSDSPFSHALCNLQTEHTRLLADHISWSFDTLQDWRLECVFGEQAMRIGLNDEPLRTITTNAELAAFIHEDLSRGNTHD